MTTANGARLAGTPEPGSAPETAPDRIDGRIALVTGAGSPDGIGYATARRLSALGAQVAIVSTTRRIHERAGELGVTGFVADLTVEAEVGALADAIGRTVGQRRCPGEQRRPWRARRALRCCAR